MQGPRVDSYLTLRNEFSKETHMLRKQETVRKGCPGREQQDKEIQEKYSAIWLTVLGFMVIGLVSWLFLVIYSDSVSFSVMHASLSHDECQ